MFAWMFLAQAVHVLAAIAWAGGHLYMAFVGWPTLLDRPGPEARPALARTSRALGPLMAVSGGLVIIAGVVRGTALGTIGSWDALVATPYGRTFALALVLSVGLATHGARSGRTLDRDLFDERAEWRPEGVRRLRRANALEVAALALIALSMVLMRFGY